MQKHHKLTKAWEEHAGFIRRLLIGMTRDRDLADDLAQETYLRAHAAFEGYRGGEVRAWLAAIAKNVFYAYARRKFFRSEVMQEGNDLKVNADDPPALELEMAVGKLSPTLQSPFLLKHRDGFTYEEIARILEIPVGTVKSRVSTAAGRLRAELGEEAVDMSRELNGKQLWNFLYGPAQGTVPADCLDANFTVPPDETLEEVNEKADARLSHGVTYKAIHKPVRHIIADLSKLAAGVALKSGHDNRDWQVRDRRMNIHVTDVPLGDLMNSIARVMVFQWSRTSEAEPTYRLYADRRAIAKRQAEWRVKSQELRRQVAERRTKFLDAVAEVAKMSESEAEKLKDKNFHLYSLWKTGTAQLTTGAFRDVVGLRETFVDYSRNLSIPISLLSDETKKLMIFTMRAFYPYWYGHGAEYPAEYENYLDEGHFGFELFPRPFGDSYRDELINFRGMGCGIRGHFFHLGYYFDIDNPWGQVMTKFRDLVAEKGVSEKAAYRRLRKEWIAARPWRACETDRLLPLDPISEHDDRLSLPVYIADGVEGTVTAIAEGMGAGVVTDSFAHERLLCPDYYNWEKHGGLIEFRARDWFKYRASQIPDEWMAKWRTRYADTGAMTLDEFSQFGVLTYEQIEENVLYDPILGKSIKKEDWNLMSTRAILRLYAVLDSRQRERLFSEKGLDLNQVPPDLWQLVMYEFQYNNIWSWNLEAILDKAQEGIRLVGEMEGSSEYEFRCFVGKEDEEVFTWKLLLPHAPDNLEP